jgi:hypothetical protein
MKCRDAREMINSYLDNKIDPAKDKILAEHIDSCPKCKAELEFLLKYRKIISEIKPVPPPENFIYELHRKIEMETAETPIKKILQAITYFLSSYRFPLEAAGVLAVAAVVFFLYRPFFNEKLPVTTSEYAVQVQQEKVPAKDRMPETADETLKSSRIETVPLKREEASSDKTILKDNIPEEKKAADDNFSAGKDSDYDYTRSGKMKKSRSMEDEKSVIESQDKSSSAGITASKEIARSKKDSTESVFDIAEKIFREFNVSVLQKDLSNNSRLYFKVKVQDAKYGSLMKKLGDEFKVQEKIINQQKPFYEIELFLEKKEKK